MRDPKNSNNQPEFISANQKIQFLEGRPNRDKVIGEGDIANLKIALNTAKTLDEFFKSV